MLTLEHALASTGYLPDGQPAAGLLIGEQARAAWKGRVFSPDARWRSPSELMVYFKFTPVLPDGEEVSRWRQEIWNEGFAPLLWVISPHRIDLYNGFGRPEQNNDSQKHLLGQFQSIEAELARLDAFAGRLAIETGQFWASAPNVHRKDSVDQRLLSDLKWLERDLVKTALSRADAQALIGRIIFTQYLLDRHIVTADTLERISGHSTLPAVLRHRPATHKLFSWLSATFNGDMFPATTSGNVPALTGLSRTADFLEALDPESGQRTFFPYRFNIIPVELISSIYEQFAHAQGDQQKKGREARKNSVHYTRLPVVSLVLDEIMDGLSGQETILDLTCGSGIFLVEALRRLVYARCQGQAPTRKLVRSVLHEQVYGVDISESAIRVAAFSLYLVAMELDPNPNDVNALKFKPLIGSSLLVGDARTIGHPGVKQGQSDPMTGRVFDLIVGNPPWSFRGLAGTKNRRGRSATVTSSQPRGEGLDFVLRAVDFSHSHTRFGLVLSAMSFFGRSRAAQDAVQHVLRTLAPVTLVNLSALRSWLFETASMPAMVLLARHRQEVKKDRVTMVQVPWTPEGARTHSFAVSPSDIMTLTLDEIEQQPLKLKATAVGRRRDLWLLDQLQAEHGTLRQQLEHGFEAGLILGKPQNRRFDAKALQGLELLCVGDIQHFHIPKHLPIFDEPFAQRPRVRNTYRAPRLLFKEMFSGSPRPVVAVAERDMVFTGSCYGAYFTPDEMDKAHLLSAILSSALAAWFFYMTSAEFGVYKEKLLIKDIEHFPVPNLETVIASPAGSHLMAIMNDVRVCDVDERTWQQIDDAVFDVYGFDETDRVILKDGLSRAQCRWKNGRKYLSDAADSHVDVMTYAETFLSVMDGWLSARKQRSMRAEVLNMPNHSPFRVVRFALESGFDKGGIRIIQPSEDASAILKQIGQRLRVKIATELSVRRELRLHGPREVVIIKPSARRYWMGGVALEDADAVVAESLTGRIF